ncbi:MULTISPECIES: transcription termination/antitermination protein NusG [Paenibacillus]|uniref:Transcription termination/antitermination NusG family protein n=1 Tax=Paenibacillus vandeheii TaxID=3035917 RepID=A0ABT8JG14_9BACL|nr:MULTISPECIES: transcription termination/antitermination NusG family protein [Paenibacillus]KGP78388.1 hypothetical protein P363_0132235 [Paenibacillus sp. MAEPY1]KGP78437.1 hypothetical protein P364_0128800 [Paenibacillus sp. MAEPY2]MDN4604002.1 transcription termination/antitermination NusG family protein [Paenibacillus vandeheii]
MWYALQVKTGFELEIAHRLNQYAVVKKVNGLIHGIFAGVKKVVNLTTKGRKLNVDSVLSGYIFVKLEDLSAELWHFFKEVPGVYKVLDWSPISSEEIEHLHNQCKGEVEVEVPFKAEEPTVSHQSLDSLHNPNTVESCQQSIEEETNVTEDYQTIYNSDIDADNNVEKLSLFSLAFDIVRKGKRTLMRIPISLYREVREWDTGLTELRNEKSPRYVWNSLVNYMKSMKRTSNKVLNE